MNTGAGLEICDLTIRFGGLTAVNGLSLEAPMGAITGLVGPNGAGKTTSFNACTGLTKPSDGAIKLFGNDISGLSVQARARLGLGRTFQRMVLFDSLSVEANIAMGAEARRAGNNPFRHFVASRAERQQIKLATDDALQSCGITDLRHVPVASLSTGQRRLVDLARVIAGGFRLLLLDEPSSGLDSNETQRLGDVVSGLVSYHGYGVLLVEHDMSLVMRLCASLYVLDFGQLIFTGTPAQTRQSDAVRAAYLGSAVA